MFSIVWFLDIWNIAQVLLGHRSRPDWPEPADSSYCLCFVSCVHHELVMSPEPLISRNNGQGWIKRRVYFIKDTRWQQVRHGRRYFSAQLLTLWLVNPIYDCDCNWHISQSEALLTSNWPIRCPCWCLSLHPRELEAVLCSCLPHLWAFSCDRAGRGAGEAPGICFWSFNISEYLMMNHLVTLSSQPVGWLGLEKY